MPRLLLGRASCGERLRLVVEGRLGGQRFACGPGGLAGLHSNHTQLIIMQHKNECQLVCLHSSTAFIARCNTKAEPCCQLYFTAYLPTGLPLGTVITLPAPF